MLSNDENEEVQKKRKNTKDKNNPRLKKEKQGSELESVANGTN
jgi:hypothetical protein